MVFTTSSHAFVDHLYQVLRTVSVGHLSPGTRGKDIVRYLGTRYLVLFLLYIENVTQRLCCDLLARKTPNSVASSLARVGCGSAQDFFIATRRTNSFDQIIKSIPIFTVWYESDKIVSSELQFPYDIDN